MSPTPADLESVYRVLARTFPRPAAFGMIAQAMQPLARETTRQALNLLCAHGLARAVGPGQYAVARASRPPARRHHGHRV